ncbi:adenylyl-sulfate kinase [Desulfomicrobium sp. ZS1]|nr:adenylyl-sulfate kinase [Desulfomicrobium sp. ZS1]UTF48901.1 adenylyl-sulfate kinase [Desulfomicrobium sp. ZS1]
MKKSVLDCAAQQFCKVPVSGYTSPFFKEHREFNVRRIGFVASEITKNGGIALCAPIAPCPEARVHNRNLISQTGGFVEAFMNTPLEVCEQRDRKGLYAKPGPGSSRASRASTTPTSPRRTRR